MPEETLKVGDVAPDFELPSDTSQTVKLSDFRGKRVVLYFYPRDDTSGCTGSPSLLMIRANITTTRYNSRFGHSLL